MFPAQFDYVRAGSVEEAIDLLRRHADRDASLLAGGHGLLPAVKADEAHPGVVVDVSDLAALDGIDVDGFEGRSSPSPSGDGALRVGAVSTHADLASSDRVRAHAPALADAAERVGDVQIRNRGTIGGNLAEADPTADLPAAVLASDATIRVRGGDGERAIPASAFFLGGGETDLRDDELIAHVRIPTAEAGAYVRKTHPATGYAVVGVAVAFETDGGTVVDARVAVTGVCDRPVTLPSVEAALEGLSIDDADSIEDEDAIAAAAERAPADLESARTIGDHHASAEYRVGLVAPYAERAIERALDRAPATDGAAEGGPADENGGEGE